MQIDNSSDALNDNPFESPKPTENAVNQQSANDIPEQANLYLSDLVKSNYLAFLRFFAFLSLIIGIIALLIFVFSAFYEIKRTRGNDSYAWLISLALALESFLAFGLLSAVADIAENMVDVGNYVRELRKQKNLK